MSRVAILCAVFAVALPLFGGSYIVTNTNDNGAGSFRQGILDANSATCTNPCTITFDSTLFATTQTISLLTPALSVNASDVLIDGFSGGTVGSANTNAFGSADNSVHRVVINGASNTCCPITVAGINFKIRGVVLQDFLTALVIQGTNATIAGCKIGTDAAGLAAGSPQNVTGIQVTSSGSATIGGTSPADRNLISGNLGAGIDLQSDGNAVLGNYIGINATGTAAIANSTGITIASNNNVIGGTSLGNVISGNSSRGVQITAGSGNNVESNRIGTNAAGTAAVANGTGVFIGSGSLPGAVDVGSLGFGNVISGNTVAGVEINNSSGSNGITDNVIGLNLAGTAAIANGTGIVLSAAGTGNTIGDNSVAGNTSAGLSITNTSSLLIQNNEIGEFSGSPFGNGGHGIVVSSGSASTTIINNVITNNGQNGVDVDGAIIGIGIKQNDIGENGGIGIDLHASATDLGATPNDAGDADTGTGNHSQNFPAIGSAYLNGTTGSATLTVTFNVDSASVGTTAGLRVEAFEADTSVSNPEGLRFLGFQCFGGNNLSNQTMAITAAGLIPGDTIVMTATSYSDASCTTVNEGTSEFSPGAIVALQPGLVVNTNDSGAGSLRQAITDANAGTCQSPCTITFNIPNTDPNFASGVFTIRPLSALPVIERSNTVLDGTTQTTFGGNTNALGPEIEINGSLAPATTTGLSIGGSTAGHGANIQIKSVVVNGFDGYGIYVAGLVPVTNAKILGCYVGTNATGSAAVANSLDGVFAGSTTTNLQIGAAFNGNIISGNGGNGIQLMSNGVVDTIILGNGIGTDQSKTTGIPNGGDGIFGDMTSMHVGGQLVGEANVIAFNAGDGITLISTATQNELRYNSIHSNGDLGIDFGNNGPDTNDALDADGDPNGGQNYPVLTLAIYNSGTDQTTVSGTLHSLANTTFDIDWYTSTTADPSGFGEGQTYENTSTWTTDGSGNANVSIVLSGNKRFSNITATATRVAGLVKETSEFSAVVQNNAPTANADTPSTNEDVPLTFDPRANDTDPEGDVLSITANTQPSPSAGSVTCSAIDCTFTPTADYSGPATFNYTISDGNGGTASASVTITVNAVDDPPVANADTLNTSEDTPNTVNVLTNDTDVDTLPANLTVTAFTNGTKGIVNCTAAGACTYTPNADQTGADSFTYDVSDGTTPVTGTVNVTITAVDDPPVANADTLTTAEDTPNSVNVLTNDTDVDTLAGNLTVTGSTNGTKGSVGCTTAGVCTYTPNADQTGADSFTYTVFDGTSSVNGTVNVTITAVDDPPVANADTLTTAEETPNTVNVLTNDTDVDTAPASLTVTAFTNGTKGTVNCTAAGACTYTPNVDQTGSDSFTYTVSDGTSTVSGTVNVTINPVDDPPVANTDTLNTTEDTPNSVNVLTNDTDVDTAPAGLSVVGSTNGAKGSVNCSTSGVCTYTPSANQTGADTFTYTVSDGTTPITGTVNVNIGGTNDPPAANPDTLTTAEETPNSVNVVANDTDPDADPLTVASNTQGSKGSVSCTVAGVCTYTPNTNQTGTDSFKYVVTDGTAFATGTVSVTITPTNDPPAALDDSASTEQGVAVTINVVANDTDPDSDPLTVVSFTQGANGSVTCSASECTYTPNAGFSGTDSFTYVVKDPSLASDTGSVSITVLSCPAAPGSLTPSHGSTNVPTSGLLAWDDTGAASYKVFLGRSDQDGCSTFAGFAYDNEFAYGNLLPGTSYTWRVESVAGSCIPQTSDCMSFKTAPLCNGSITLIQPIGGTHGSPIEFRWTAVANATEYQVFVFGQNDSGLVFPIGTTTGTSLVANVPGNGPMTWYVVATIPNCGTVQSPPESFTLCNRPATPEARVVGQVTSSQKYKVEWDAVANAVRYEVDQADNPQFTNPTTISTEQTFVQFEHEVNAPRALYFRVRSFGSCTQTPSANSTTIRVVIVPLPPRDTPDHGANVPAGSEDLIVMEVFIPGEPGQTLFFTAATDRPWLAVAPPNGTLPPEGVTLRVTADPKTLPNGTFTASVIVTITSPSSLTGHGTSTFIAPVSISLVTPVSPVASKTAPDPNTLIIPAVGHLDGIDSHWQSDIRVTNVGFSSAKYDLTFVPAGGTSSGIKKTTITVDAGATTALDDILNNWFGVGSLGDGANGMLEIRAADGKPMSAVASSRTYNVTANGTLGQFIPALKFGSFIGKALPGAAKSVLSLQQVAQSQLYRTNVGVAEASGNAADVLLSVFNITGTKLTDIPLQLKAGEQQQLNGLLSLHGITADDARIEVTVPSGDGKVTAYASVVDNATLDPLLVHGVPLDGSTSAKWVLPGVADLANTFANWRTDMRIFNAGLASQTATLTLFGGGSPLTAQVTLQPGEVRALDDVVRSLFLAQNVGGAVHITTSSPGTLVVTGRTYNQTGNGTYGQFIPAVTPDEAIGAGGGTLHVLQVEDSSRYRTNLGIAEVTGKPVTVEVQVVLPDSKVTPTVSFDMAANEFRQFGIIREMGLGNVYNGRLAVRVIGGEGRVTAYGSVIDMVTQDPTYVPAQR